MLLKSHIGALRLPHTVIPLNGRICAMWELGRKLGLFGLICCCLLLLPTLVSPLAAEEAPLRLGLVKFGSGAWVIDVVRREEQDKLAGLVLQTVDLANPAAGEVALQAGGVDVILSDFLWVARQRAAGQPLVFIPRSSALGEVLVPAGSSIHSLADLEGKKLGIAGGPLDKSWLLLRAYSRNLLGHDIAGRVSPMFGAPPLLSQELAQGRLDAVLTFWPFAARLAVQGQRSLLSMADVMRGLGFDAPVPLMGFAVNEVWAKAHPQALVKFLAATSAADQQLARSDEEWRLLRPLTAAEDDATLVALRDRYRAGIGDGSDAGAEAQAARLYRILAEIGGAELTGGAPTLPGGTFWAGAGSP